MWFYKSVTEYILLVLCFEQLRKNSNFVVQIFYTQIEDTSNISEKMQRRALCLWQEVTRWHVGDWIFVTGELLLTHHQSASSPPISLSAKGDSLVISHLRLQLRIKIQEREFRLRPNGASSGQGSFVEQRAVKYSRGAGLRWRVATMLRAG